MLLMNMNFIVRLSAIILIVHNVYAQITFDTKNIARGEYYYAYDDGLSSKDETGNLDSEGNSVVTGQYRYILGDTEYIVTYTADKNGYHPKVTISDYESGPLTPLGASGYDPSLVASLLG